MKFKALIFYAIAFFAVAAIVSVTITNYACSSSEPGVIRDSTVVATLNGEKITGAELIERMPDSGNMSESEISTLRKAVLEQILHERLLTQEADKRGISVSPAEVTELIEEQRQGNEAAFQQYLDRIGMTEAQFRKALRTDLIIRKLSEEVKVELRSSIEVTEEDVSEYYNRNLDSYNRSEVAHIYVRIEPPGGEDEVAAAVGRTRELIRRLQNGADFATLAKRESNDLLTKENGGNLGRVSDGVLSNTHLDIVQNLSAGEITEQPVEGQNGFHIFKLLDEEYAPLEEVEPMIRASLVQNRLEEAMRNWLKKLWDNASKNFMI